MGEFLASAAESVIYICFLNAFCESKRKGLEKWGGGLLAAIFLFGNIWIADRFYLYHWATTVVDCLIIFVYSYLFLEKSGLNWFLAAILYNLGLAASVACCMNISILVFPSGLAAWMQPGTLERDLLLLVNKIFLVGYVYGIILLKRRFRDVFYFKIRKEVFLFLLFALIMFCLILQLLLQNYKAGENSWIHIILMTGIFGFILISALQFIKNINAKKKIHETELLLEIYQSQKQSFENEFKHYEKIRKIQHDMKNHLLGIRYFLEKEKTGDAIEYIDKLLQDFLKNTEEVACSDSEELLEKETASTTASFAGSLWESFINMKLSEAAYKGINVKKRITAASASDLNPVELCSILGNLLDNAIEAEERNRIHRELTIEIWEYASLFCISIENWVDNEYMNAAKELISQKKDPELHGIGIRNIKELVEKNNGKLETRISENRFCVKVALPMKR